MSVGVQIGTFEMDAREDLVLTFNMAAWLDPGDVLVAGTPELRRIRDDASYTAGLFGPALISGQLIAQQVRALDAGERYWLILPFTVSGHVFAPRLQITCAEG